MFQSQRVPFFSAANLAQRYTDGTAINSLGSAVTFAYLIERLHGRDTRSFLADDEKVYCAAVKVENEQGEVNQNSIPSTAEFAFKQADTPCQTSLIPTADLIKPGKFLEVVNESKHVILDYQTAPDDSRQFYFGHNGAGCTFFSPFITGGEINSSCEQLANYAGFLMGKNANQAGMTTVVKSTP